MPNKTSLKTFSVAGTAAGKTITTVQAYSHGSVDVVEIIHSGGTLFVKFKQGEIEVGGTNEFNTGTTKK